MMLDRIIGLENELFPKSTDGAAGEEPGADVEPVADEIDTTSFYKKVIDDYADTDDDNVGWFRKAILDEMRKIELFNSWTLALLEHAKLYRNLEQKYHSAIKRNTNIHTNRARYLFCAVAICLLRMGNSSAILERIFGDSLRSVCNRRTCIRKDNILEKVDYFNRYSIDFAIYIYSQC